MTDQPDAVRMEQLRRQIEERQRELDARWAAYETEGTDPRIWSYLEADVDRLAGERDRLATARDDVATARDLAAAQRDVTAADPDRTSGQTAAAASAADRLNAGHDRDAALSDRVEARQARERSASDRAHASADRGRAAASRAELAAELESALAQLSAVAREHDTVCAEAALAYQLSGALYEQLALTETDERHTDDLLRSAERQRERAAATTSRAARSQAALAGWLRRCASEQREGH